jgi:hypothetical protein
MAMPSGNGALWRQVYTDLKWNLRCRFPNSVEGRRDIVGIVGRWALPAGRVSR